MNNVSVSGGKSPVRNAILGFQHLLAMYSGDILVPLLLVGRLDLTLLR